MSQRSLRSWFVALVLSAICVGTASPPAWAASADSTVASHKQIRVIRPELDNRSANLNTFAMSPQGELWLCCSTHSSLPAESDEKPKPGCVLIYSVEGKLLKTVDLEFIPQAINFTAAGVPFLAGDGKVARLTTEGEVDLVIDAPNLLPEDELKAKLREKNQAMITRLLEGGEAQIKRLEEQIAKLEEGQQEAADASTEEDEEAAKRQKARSEVRLKVLKQQLDFQKEMLDQQKTAYEGMLENEVSVSQVARSTGIAVGTSDIFVSLPSIEGQGYAVYRMTHDLTEPKLVVDSLSGCCGQMDIQSDGTHLIVADNSSFKVRYLDRDGEDVRSFGERSGSSGSAGGSSSGWGSCCNPMNVRCIDDKEILVAESSIGHIKRYTPTGEYLGLVGTAKIAGGCKHVAIAKDSKRDWYFMMNTAGNNIAVLVPLSEAPAETEDERETRLAMEGLGQKLIGAWKAEPKKTSTPSNTEAENEASNESEAAEPSEDIAISVEVNGEETTEESEDGDAEVTVDNFDFGQYILSQNRYLRLDANGNVSRTEPVTPVANAPAPSKGFFGAIASIFIGESSTTAPSIPEEPTQWIAIRQDGDVIQFALVESEVRNYVATVRFIDDKTAEFKWYYNEASGEPMATATYRKVADGKKAESCDPATCKGADCDKPNCEHEHAGDANPQGDEEAAVATETSSKE